MFLNQRNYNKSNKITSIKFRVSDEAIFLAKKILILKKTSNRQKIGERLLDELCDAARIDIIKLKISETNQYHRKSGGRVVFKQYGYYRTDNKYIYIQNLTAVRGQILAPKTFLDTLLHEWLHHYDTHRLKLNSIHTKGFYLRLKNLKEKLKIS